MTLVLSALTTAGAAIARRIVVYDNFMIGRLGYLD